MKVLDTAPDGYHATNELCWVDGIAEHDQFGMIPPTLCQKWVGSNADSEPVLVIVPFMT